MVKAKKTRKFAAVKRMLNPNDIRLKENQIKQKKKDEEEKEKLVRRVPQVASSLFFAHNTALVPPYRVLIDTNFINFSLQNKLELISGMMDCLFAKLWREILDLNDYIVLIQELTLMIAWYSESQHTNVTSSQHVIESLDAASVKFLAYHSCISSKGDTPLSGCQIKALHHDA
ncbi:hypothetical protein C0989_012111 [Termitomyces sp. Mn162]|nr:hypothetical protein C0989_012111 [Termitomyces sp. Mn162]